MTHSIFEKTGGTYTKASDCYIPNIQVSESEKTDEIPIGKYGRMRESYLKQHRSPTYNYLLMSEKLHSHLKDVEQQAQHLLETMMPQMAKAENVTEELKAKDQMLWVGKMNNIKSRVEEIIFAEIIYQ